MDGLLAPAWLVALATAFFLGAKAVIAVKGVGYPVANGLAPELRAALTAVTVTLTALTERLAQLPTREDLVMIAEKNRHAYRNDLLAAQGTLSEQVDRVEGNILREIARPT